MIYLYSFSCVLHCLIKISIFSTLCVLIWKPVTLDTVETGYLLEIVHDYNPC